MLTVRHIAKHIIYINTYMHMVQSSSQRLTSLYRRDVAWLVDMGKAVSVLQLLCMCAGTVGLLHGIQWVCMGCSCHASASLLFCSIQLLQLRLEGRHTCTNARAASTAKKARGKTQIGHHAKRKWATATGPMHAGTGMGRRGSDNAKQNAKAIQVIPGPRAPGVRLCICACGNLA